MQIMPPVSDILPIWDHLSDLEKQLAQSSASVRHLNAGASVCSGGYDCMGLVYVLSGELRVYMMSDEGREITLYRLGRDDLCLLTAACALKEITFEVHVGASSDTRLMIIGADVFEALMKSNVYAEAFAYRSLALRFSQVMFVLQQILFKRFDRRLAAFLSDEADKADSCGLLLTHEQIARHMGSAREVVTRMLKYFTQEGLVSLSRGGLKILDRDRLRMLGQG